MDIDQKFCEGIEFPPFETISKDAFNQFRMNTSNFNDLHISDNYHYDTITQKIEEFLNIQIDKEDLQYFPQDELNALSFSPKRKDIYLIVKDKVTKFTIKLTENLVEQSSPTEISRLWHFGNKIIQNISYYFSRLGNDEETFVSLFNSQCNKQLSENSAFIHLLHNPISCSFSSQTISWQAIDCSNILDRCNLFRADLLLSNFQDIYFFSLNDIKLYVEAVQSLIPSKFRFAFFDYINNSIPDLLNYFIEIPKNWKSAQALFDIYEYKGQSKEFMKIFADLIKSQMSAYNPFEILDSIRSFASTNFMYVIRNIALALFNNDNNAYSILLANYIHNMFLTLKQRIEDDRLFLFDDIGQQSNGYFVRYHSHYLLKRLLFYNSVTFDADERFAKMCNNSHVLTIINDFKEKQLLIQSFVNPSPILTFSLFSHEFFFSYFDSKLRFPDEFESIVQSFESFIKGKKMRIEWDFFLSQVVMKGRNFPNLHVVKCNAAIACILLALSKSDGKAQKIDLMQNINFGEIDFNEAIEALKAHSLVCLDDLGEVTLNGSVNALDKKIIIPSAPQTNSTANNAMISKVQLEASIARFIKIKPGLAKNELFDQISHLELFRFTEKDFEEALGNLIRKQIVVPPGNDATFRIVLSF